MTPTMLILSHTEQKMQRLIKKGEKKMQRLARGVLNIKNELLIEGFEVLDQPGVERT